MPYGQVISHALYKDPELFSNSVGQVFTKVSCFKCLPKILQEKQKAASLDLEYSNHVKLSNHLALKDRFFTPKFDWGYCDKFTWFGPESFPPRLLIYPSTLWTLLFGLAPSLMFSATVATAISVSSLGCGLSWLSVSCCPSSSLSFSPDSASSISPTLCFSCLVQHTKN